MIKNKTYIKTTQKAGEVANIGECGEACHLFEVKD